MDSTEEVWSKMMDTATSRLIYAAAIALVIGVIVYLIDRQADAYFLTATATATIALPPLFGVFGQHLPSFVHIYAFILLTVVCLPPRRELAITACAAWFLVECLFEAGQHPSLQIQFIERVPAWFDGMPLLEASAGFFSNGSFDPLDILALALGTAAAWFTIYLTRSTRHENA